MSSPETEIANADNSQEKKKLTLDVRVDKPSVCERHVTVTIDRADVDRYFDDAISGIMPNAAVPGFRAGRAPRKLVEQRFRSQVADQVKGSLLMDSMTQISEEQDFSAISEPDFDFEAIEIPDNGPMTFEFDLEVRPEFEMPEWKGLKLDRLTREFSAKDIDGRLADILQDMATLVPTEDAATPGDYIVANITASHNGRAISEANEEEIQILPVISFPDARLEGFDKLMEGVKAGETRKAQVMISHDSAATELQGETIDLEFNVLEVKKVELPPIDAEVLESLGNLENEGELRDAVKVDLERRMEYQQQRRVRQQITSLLTASANWELPPDLVRRQSRRELDRAMLEMRSSGFSDDEIRAYENELRQNTLSATRKALHEHFILERIAEDQNVDADPADYDAEVQLIARQGRESVRRVRARIEKQGLMDALRNQIIERKVINLITEHAKFNDVPYDPAKNATFPVELSLSGASESNIPIAKHGGDSQQLQQPADHT
ncbi:MAG: trigger factor [Planctomycetales bacterium]|nr:trigger factor [Planctomycetales bacterium]